LRFAFGGYLAHEPSASIGRCYRSICQLAQAFCSYMQSQATRNMQPIEAEEVIARAISLGRMSFLFLHIFENWLHLVKRRIERVSSFGEASFRAISKHEMYDQSPY
jgi:hypothetical protein